MNIKELIEYYNSVKNEIKVRINEFKKNINESDEKIFAELAFCLCTPQSNAIKAWESIRKVYENKLLFYGNEKDIKKFLNVRFADSKARYIVLAREKFSIKGKIEIKNILKKFRNSYQAREWLIKNVKGMGMKEASHFLRNIGLGLDLAILDVHILKNLEKFNVIKSIPKNLNKTNYLRIEKKMKDFSKKISIPFEELDLVLWSLETGKVFK